jgi:hypothetical protein
MCGAGAYALGRLIRPSVVAPTGETTVEAVIYVLFTAAAAAERES